MSKLYAVYMMTNWKNDVIYVGRTSDLKLRAYEHRTGMVEGFTSKYKLKKLVYYEAHESYESAETREKYLKGKGKAFKRKLIDGMNPEWQDLYGDLL